ncbi:protein-disulfide reductase DsbD family protein [Algivirga pacifica]|uniref:Thioredoxin family protein n=1 Tax=Algivirga pacifica TaxID=1162670 RepID=A0ABP9D6C4_9BACT
MKKLFSLIIGLLWLIPLSVQAQLLQGIGGPSTQVPVKWESSMSTQSAEVGEVITLTFTAKIQPEWYLYSNDFDADLGPVLTSVKFEENGTFELVGELTPVDPKRKYDETWEGEISYFKKEGNFQQKVKVLSKDFAIKANLKGQVCSDKLGSCIPVSNAFTFSLKEVTGAAVQPRTGQIIEKKAEEVAQEGTASDNVKKQVTTVDNAQEEESMLSMESEEGEMSVWGFMVLAFMSGLGALLTPCVFPMIPLTVSFFTNQKGGKGKAILYGTSIVLIYGFIGVVLAPLFGNPAIANQISTHWLTNTLFFLTFIVFAISFFGAFEITLPSSLVNKMDAQSDKGGLAAVFFMALTLVLVSFSCTGPIASTILIQSIGGDFLKPALGMTAFGLAFALPFTMFALFPKLLNGLPKSGGWMNSVKVVFGFVELALSLKFLSMIDLVYHWNILDKDVMVAIWIVIFTLMGFYLLGKLRLPHDAPLDKVSVPRLLLSIATFSFVVYLIPGMFGAPLNLLSGILPPQTHHSFDLGEVVRTELRYHGPVSGEKQSSIQMVKHDDLFDLPHGLDGYFDWEQAAEASRREGKPIFIDFTGKGCANCRKMEDNVWSDPRVMQRLRKDYIIVALYVDDPTELPESEWYTSELDGQVKKTIGDQNFDFERRKFGNLAQPYYCLVDADGDLLVKKPVGYEPNATKFVQYLDKGIENYKKQNELTASKK